MSPIAPPRPSNTRRQNQLLSRGRNRDRLHGWVRGVQQISARDGTPKQAWLDTKERHAKHRKHDITRRLLRYPALHELRKPSMNPAELRELIRQGENSGGLLHAEALPVSGRSLADLDPARLTDYLGRVLADEVPQDATGWLDRLCGLGFMTERAGASPVCTIAGVVLFAHRPRRLLRQAGVRWMAFAGDDMEYQALDDKLLDAPLVGLWAVAGSGEVFRAQPGLIELFMERAQPFVSSESAELAEHLRRERRWEYPPDALREAVVNAIAHRDWTRPLEVEVVRYHDRLTVTSPGGLQNSMTVAKMLAGQRSPRNPIIVGVLRDYGYVDARGMGVRRKIVPLIRAFAGAEARFEPTDDYLRVVLPVRARE